MDFTTTNDYGKKGAGSGFVTVSVGSLVLDNKLVAVTAETKWPGEEQSEEAEVISRAIHSRTANDPDTGYPAPTEYIYRWAAPVIGGAKGDAVDATLQLELGPPNEYKGLVDKVDVLAEIPYVIKTMVNYVAGTKPYIYQASVPLHLLCLYSADLVHILVDEPSEVARHRTRLIDFWSIGRIDRGGPCLQRSYFHFLGHSLYCRLHVYIHTLSVHTLYHNYKQVRYFLDCCFCPIICSAS